MIYDVEEYFIEPSEEYLSGSVVSVFLLKFTITLILRYLIVASFKYQAQAFQYQKLVYT